MTELIAWLVFNSTFSTFSWHWVFIDREARESHQPAADNWTILVNKYLSLSHLPHAEFKLTTSVLRAYWNSIVVLLISLFRWGWHFEHWITILVFYMYVNLIFNFYFFTNKISKLSFPIFTEIWMLIKLFYLNLNLSNTKILLSFLNFSFCFHSICNFISSKKLVNN